MMGNSRALLPKRRKRGGKVQVSPAKLVELLLPEAVRDQWQVSAGSVVTRSSQDGGGGAGLERGGPYLLLLALCSTSSGGGGVVRRPAIFKVVSVAVAPLF